MTLGELADDLERLDRINEAIDQLDPHSSPLGMTAAELSRLNYLRTQREELRAKEI
jgi:hypothetical protein